MNISWILIHWLDNSFAWTRKIKTVDVISLTLRSWSCALSEIAKFSSLFGFGHFFPDGSGDEDVSFHNKAARFCLSTCARFLLLWKCKFNKSAWQRSFKAAILNSRVTNNAKLDLNEVNTTNNLQRNIPTKVPLYLHFIRKMCECLPNICFICA